MGWFTSSQKKLAWENLTDKSQVDAIFNSGETALIFKHSTRCSISAMALNRFENDWNEDSSAKLWFLDLISYRDVSNYIAEKSGVVHQSPQAILISGGKVIYDNSHNGISASEILNLV